MKDKPPKDTYDLGSFNIGFDGKNYFVSASLLGDKYRKKEIYKGNINPMLLDHELGDDFQEVIRQEVIRRVTIKTQNNN